MNGLTASACIPSIRKILITLVLLLAVAALAACSKSGGSSDNSVPTVVELDMTLPSAGNFPVGASADIAVTARLSDGTTKPLNPEQFNWTSSNPGFASVSSDGVVTGKAAGGATIIGSLSGLPSGTLGVKVVETPPNPRALTDVRIKSRARTNVRIVGPAGASTRDLALIGIYDVTGGKLRMPIPAADTSWVVDNTSVASDPDSVTPITLKFLAAGNAFLTGTESLSPYSLSEQLGLLVTNEALQKLSIEGAPDTMLTGTSADLSAIADFNSSELDVTSFSHWTSNDANVVSLGTIADNRQPITAEAAGNATVTAEYTLNSVKKTADAPIEVKDATLDVAYATDTKNEGNYQQLCTLGTASYSPSQCTMDDVSNPQNNTVDVSVSSSLDRITIDRIKFTAEGTSWQFQTPLLRVSGITGNTVPIDTTSGLQEGQSVSQGSPGYFAMEIKKSDLPDRTFTIRVLLYFKAAATGQTMLALDSTYRVNVNP